MKLYQQNKTRIPFLTIVTCQHGDEPFGLRILDAFKPHLDRFPGMQLIIANEQALSLKRRDVDGDLNRSFPGSPSGHHEERLAFDLLKRIRSSDYVLDIHTSVSDCGRLLPIVTTLNEHTRTLINLLDAPAHLVGRAPSGRTIAD